MNSLEILDNSDRDLDQRTCPSCDGSQHVELNQYSLPPWRIVGCRECSFVYLANPVDYDDLVEDQAWESNVLGEIERRKKDRPISYRLSRLTRRRLKILGRPKSHRFLNIFKGGRILDVGCGKGENLPPPLVPYGVEISKNLSRIADKAMRARGGLCIHENAVDGVKSFEDQFFDGVLLRSFLEHEINPQPLLQGLHRILKKDGIVYIRVPNFSSINRRIMGRKWCGFRYPDHVNYFTVKSLSGMVEKAGFRLRLVNRANVMIDDNIKAILVKA